MTRTEQIAVQMLIRGIRDAIFKLDSEIMKLPKDPTICQSYLRDKIGEIAENLDKIEEVSEEVK